MKIFLPALILGCGLIFSVAQADEKPTVKTTVKTTPKTAKKAPINLKYCPISGENVANSGRGGQIIGGYRVQLCCPDCIKTFAKMPAAEKLGRVKEMAARQAKAKRAG